MAGSKILLLGSTGTSGICLIRELLFRKHAIVAYVRNPSKIPPELASNPFLEIQIGEMDDTAALSAAISQASMIVSLLGPASMRNHPDFGEWYSTVLKLMREHNVKRILAPVAATGNQPGDTFHLTASILTWTAKNIFPELYTTARAVEKAFQDEGEGLEWTVYRLGNLAGAADEESWRKEREIKPYVGSVGGEGWHVKTDRSSLAKWLVDCVEGEQDRWIRQWPAISR